ncbi:MAG TPA: L,D-transpeptidase family protein [Steroidobacteraceae bacterium]|nr:L,D-transpeptidase family protein [Steroidobacteraceae bacterium]
MRRILPALLSLLSVPGLAWPDIASNSIDDSVRPALPAPGALGDNGVLSAIVPLADAIVVRKAERRLYLMRRGEVLRSYRVALGLVPEGPKQRAGDFRTPEGRYQLTRRNPRSDYFLSIQVSYPNYRDLRRARHEHVDPGGSIMLHGLPNNLRHPPEYYAKSDWTDGCIAMSDSDMVELWMMTQDNTPIEILP